MEQMRPTCGWLGSARQCSVACRKDDPCARPAQRGGIYVYSQLYLLLISVLLFLSFLLASMAYVMKGKEMLLRRGQGASKSPFPLFSGHWVAGKGEIKCFLSVLRVGCSWCPVNLCCAQGLLGMV